MDNRTVHVPLNVVLEPLDWRVQSHTATLASWHDLPGVPRETSSEFLSLLGHSCHVMAYPSTASSGRVHDSAILQSARHVGLDVHSSGDVRPRVGNKARIHWEWIVEIKHGSSHFIDDETSEDHRNNVHHNASLEKICDLDAVGVNDSS